MANMQDVPFIDSEQIYLRELRESDLSGPWYTWLNDVDVTTFQNKGIFPNSIEKQTQYYNSLINNPNEVVLAIIEKESGKHIGCTGLHNINWVHRSAELGIVIGDRNAWGKKFGKQAWKLICDYGFQTLNLHRIYAIVVEGNIASAKSAEAAGFKLDGLMRHLLYKNGKYLNAHYYSKLRTEL
ncbi:N-acetyltransferase [Pedobacter yonginense]|uniref:N-acetyltransferase n=1 Tax=Pedobacter yonginense TaxID=651869 RepID=A0A317ENN3_9SPHI|nr:GNAT family protein [Pedobacter yonginense]PWS28172.1 N-acetyltransferase [Pedobacter yonginense]